MVTGLIAIGEHTTNENKHGGSSEWKQGDGVSNKEYCSDIIASVRSSRGSLGDLPSLLDLAEEVWETFPAC